MISEKYIDFQAARNQRRWSIAKLKNEQYILCYYDYDKMWWAHWLDKILAKSMRVRWVGLLNFTWNDPKKISSGFICGGLVIIFLLIYVNNQQKLSTRKTKNSSMYIFHHLFRWTLISLGMNLAHVSIEGNENAFSIVWFSFISKQESWRELTNEVCII